MTHEHEAERSPYLLEHYSRAERARVLAFSMRRRETHPVTRGLMEKFFSMPLASVSEARMRYFHEFVRLADIQLVLGLAFGPNASGSLDVRLSNEKKLLYSGKSYWHDMAHTITALWDSPDPESLASLTPSYEGKRMQGTELFVGSETHGAGLREWRAQKGEEDMALRIFGAARFGDLEAHLKSFDDVKKFLETFTEFTAHRSYPVPWRLKAYLRRLHRNFTSENGYLFQIFVESSLPLMQKYAPEAARVLREESAILARPKPRGSARQTT